MVGLKKKKTVTYAKISPKVVNPRDIAGERKKKKKKKKTKQTNNAGSSPPSLTALATERRGIYTLAIESVVGHISFTGER